MHVRTSTRFRRERDAARAARAFVAHALRSAGVPRDLLDCLVLATAEAANNVVLHADGHAFTVDVVVDGRRAEVTVSDSGTGFRPPARPTMPEPWASGRRGLALMRALVEDVTVASGPGGTTVTLGQSFSAAAHAAPVGADT